MAGKLTAKVLVLGALALALPGVGTANAAGADDLASARAATAGFHRIAAAEGAGFGLFTDAAGIACIDKPGSGAMGVHYVNGGNVDAVIDAALPEAVIYEPTRNGRMRLVGVEYVVVKEVWDATHSSRPSLFGTEFEETGAVNRYGLPPYYSLHAWIWKHNPSGMLEDWNPEVSCADA